MEPGTKEELTTVQAKAFRTQWQWAEIWRLLFLVDGRLRKQDLCFSCWTSLAGWVPVLLVYSRTRY